jgi:putative lysine/arginine/ornithine/histidine/octopine transport system permease protein
MSFDFDLVARSLPRLLSASVLTIELTVTSLAAGLAMGTLLGLMRIGRSLALRQAAWTYSLLFRGTPLLVQIFLIYYGLGQFQFLRDSVLWYVLRKAFWCTVLALALNSAAYTSEIIRGAVEAIPRGQWEAASALGLRRSAILSQVIWPQALVIGLPSYGNEAVMMIKSTALASTVTMLDLTGVARTIVADTYAPYEIFITAGCIYLVITTLVQKLFGRLEHLSGWRRADRGLRRG